MTWKRDNIASVHLFREESYSGSRGPRSDINKGGRQCGRVSLVGAHGLRAWFRSEGDLTRVERFFSL